MYVFQEPSNLDTENDVSRNLPKMSFTNMIFNFIDGAVNNGAFFPSAFEQGGINLNKGKKSINSNVTSIFAIYLNCKYIKS